MKTSSNVMIQAAVSTERPTSVMVTITVVTGPMNQLTAVSNSSVYFIVVLILINIKMICILMWA